MAADRSVYHLYRSQDGPNVGLTIGNVLSRPEQLPQLALVNQTTGGIWAATIRHHDGVFYVTTTLVFDGAPQLSPSRWDNVWSRFLLRYNDANS